MMEEEPIYVERDASGAIRGVFACPQPGYAEEALHPDTPDVVAYLNPPPPPEPTPLEKLEAAGLTVADLKVLLGLK
jgi:hypothetical protein